MESSVRVIDHQTGEITDCDLVALEMSLELIRTEELECEELSNTIYQMSEKGSV